MADIRLPEDSDFWNLNVDKINFRVNGFTLGTFGYNETFYTQKVNGNSLFVYKISKKERNFLGLGFDRAVLLGFESSVFHHGVLPVINFTDFVKSCAKLVDADLGIYEFGRYMKSSVGFTYEYEELENAFNNNKMKKTGRTYTINGDCTKDNMYPTTFKPLELEEYEYDAKYFKGKYFVRTSTENNENYLWYAVEPVRWCLNKEKNCLISTNILLAGIPYFLDGTEKRDYESSFIKMFLEKYLYKDIFQGLKYVESKENTNENVNEVQGLVDEIKKYSEYCFDKDSVFAKVNEYITAYKNEINSLKNDKSGLVLKDEKTLYLELINNLSNLLDKLKKYHADNLIYFDIIDIINNCLSILQGDVVISSSNELEKDMKVIHDVVVPFLGDNVVFEELRNLFVNEKNEIMDYLNKKVNIAGLSLEDNKELYTSSYDFEIKMREKLMPLLISMNDKVNQKDLVDEVNKSIEGSLANIPIKTKNRIAKVYMNAINGEVIKINRLSGSELYQNELKDILDFKVDYENSTDEIISILQKVLISLYKLEDKIAKENIRNSSLENYEEVGNIKL